MKPKSNGHFATTLQTRHVFPFCSGCLRRHTQQFHAAGDELLEVLEVASRHRHVARHGASGDHAVRMRATLSSCAMEKLRSHLRLLPVERTHSPLENGKHRVLLLFAVRTVAEFRPGDRRGTKFVPTV